MSVTENHLERERHITIFFCQRIDPRHEENRRVVEKESGGRIRLFPLPCSGRIESLQLLRAIEEGADRVYLITCPEGGCRYREGNLRAGKRLRYARGLIEEIGLEPERIRLVVTSPPMPKALHVLVREIIEGEPSGRTGSTDPAESHSE